MKQPEILKTGKDDLLLLDPRNIEVIEDFNVRDDYGDMDWLIDDIRLNGVKIPIRVHKKFGSDGIFILTDGHRRHKAAMTLIEEGIQIRIPAIREPKVYSDERRLIDMFSLAEGNKQLNAVEQAKVVGKLMNYGLDVKEISEKIHKSQAYISNLNQLNNAPAKIKKFIAGKVISATLAIQILRENKNYDKAIELIEGLMSYKENKDTANDTEPEEIKISKKITKKDIQKNEGKVNSFAELCKFFKFYNKISQKNQIDIQPEKQELFNFLLAIVQGDYTIDNFKAVFDLAEQAVTEEK